jgi:hypothetical protein
MADGKRLKMGWQNAFAVVFQAGNTIINPNGEFIYFPDPGTGNLVASSTAAAGTDEFGNPYQAGDTVYGTGGGYISVQDVGGVATILFNPNSATHVTAKPEILAAALNAGAVNERNELKLSSGTSGGHSDAAYVLDGEAADSSTIAVHRFFISNTVYFAVDAIAVIASAILQATAGLTVTGGPITSTAGTPASPTLITTDSWHVMTPLLNGWAAAGAPNPRPQYRLGNGGGVETAGSLNGAAATNPQFFTLPAGYRPATSQPQIGCGATGNVTAGHATFIQEDTSGNLTVSQQAALPAPGVFTWDGTLWIDLL